MIDTMNSHARITRIDRQIDSGSLIAGKKRVGGTKDRSQTDEARACAL